MKPEIFVSAFDLHFPDIHWPTFKSMSSFLSQNRVDGFVFGGDQFNNECISHHTKGKPGLRLPGQFALDEEMFEEMILSPLERLLPKKCEKVWICGNHDHWESEFEEEIPELRDKLQRPRNLKLAARGWQVIPLGGIYKHGKLSWIHGEGIGTANHSKRAVDVYCTNLVYGHHHTMQSHTKILSSDYSQRWVAQCSPIVGGCNPRYLESRPNNWLNGFTITEFYSRGMFNHYPVVTDGDGAFSYGGTTYKATR